MTFSISLLCAQARQSAGNQARQAHIVLTPRAEQQAVRNIARLTWAFEPNAGQTDARVKFLARADGATIFLTQSEAVIAWPPNVGRQSRTAQPSANALRMQFIGASQTAAISGENELPGRINYLIGRDPRQWRTDIPHYAAVAYLELYPGVSARFYAGARGLEYDISTLPGADLRRVILRARDARLRLDSRGDLLVHTAGRDVLMRRPEIFQLDGSRKISVEGGYRLIGDNSFGFRAGPHRHDLPLVIDPSISITYTTFLGGSGAEKGNSVAVDSTGAIYVGGTTTDVTTFPEKTTCNDVSSSACTGASVTGKTTPYLFVAKIIPSNSGAAQLDYLTFIGGSGDDEGGNVALDSSPVSPNPPDLAVVGWTTSKDFPVTNGSALNIAGNRELTVSKLNGTGNAFVYSDYFGGSGAEATQGFGGIATDAAGDIFVTSDTTSTDLPQPITPNGFQTAYGGGVSDGFLAEFASTTGTLMYSSYFGINATVGSTSVVVDASGNAYIAGFTSQPSNTFPPAGVNTFQSAYGGGTDDGIVLEVNPNLVGPTSLVYASFLGGNNSDQAFAIAVDNASPPNAYVTGSTNSTDFVSKTSLTDGFQTSLGSAAISNAFLAVISQAAITFTPALTYASYLGGTKSDSGLGIAVVLPSSPGPATNVLVAGKTTSADFPVFCPSQSLTGTQDAFVAGFNPTASGFASLLDSTFLGGSTGNTEANSIATDSSGDAIVFGDTASADYPIGGNPNRTSGFQQTCTSCALSTPEPDAFLSKATISTAPAACVGFNPASTNFGLNNPVGAAALPIAEQLTDDGNSALTITGMNISGANSTDFSLNPNACPVNPVTPPSVTAGGTCSFQVNFTPSAAGAESATLQITGTDANANNIAAALDMTGTGTAPEVSLTTPSGTCPITCPAALTFGTVAAGTTSSVQIVTLTNTGNSALTISSVVIDPSVGTPSAFITNQTLTPNACGSSPSVAAGGTCKIGVEFKPPSGTASGTPFTGQLDVNDDANNNSSAMQTVALSGTGIAQAFIVAYNPTSLSFGNQTVGTTSSAQSFTLTNTGTGTLNITSITPTGTNANEFLINSAQTTCPIGGAGVGPNGGSCVIAVNFAPTAIGAASANISIADNSSNTPSPQNVPVSGTGTGAVASLSATTMTFGSVQVGTTSVVQTATLTNTGSANLVLSGLGITGTNAVDFQLNAQTTCTTGGSGIAPNASCTIAVDFAPQATGSLFASVSIADNAASSPQTISLSGTGTQAVASLSQTSLSFGSVNVGTTSMAPSITLTNSGNQTLTISSVSIDPSVGTPADFSFASSNNTCKTVGALQPNSNCTITLSFTPAATGTITGQVDIADNAPGSPQTISLSGTGTAPGVSLSPSTLNFGGQTVGMTSAGQNVTLTNSGSGALTISSISITGTNSGDFHETNNCPGSLNPSTSCVISITFAPLATGSRSASLSLADNASSSPQTAAFAGTGTQAVVVTSPTQVSFAATLVGTSSSPMPITVSNTGNGTLVISSLTFSGSNVGDFSETDNCTGASNAVPPQKSCTINVVFVPVAAGSRSASLTITDNTATPTQIIPVTGQATDFQLQVSGGSTSATVTAGQTAIFPLQINPQNGFTGTINLGCTNPPLNGSCTVSPTSIQISGSSAVSFSVNVGTAARSLLIPRSPRSSPPRRAPRIPAYLWLLAGVLSLVLLRRASGRKRLVPRFVLAFAVVLLASCAGGGGNNNLGGTPPGSYTVIATGSVGSGAAHTISLTVTVN